ALQHDRYWVEAGRTYTLAKNPQIESAYHRAREIVQAIADRLTPGRAIEELEQAARGELGEYYPTAHMYGLGNGIGLDLWEAPFLGDDAVKHGGWETAVSQLDA